MITSSRYSYSFIIILAMIIALIVSYEIDILRDRFRDFSSGTFNPFLYYILAAAIPLILAASVTALAWFVLVKLPPNILTAGSLIAAGAVIIGAYLTVLTGFPPEWRNTFLSRFRMEIIEVGARSTLYQMAAFWLVLGVVSLLRGKRQGRSGETLSS